MGNSRFRLSHVIPNVWFYKLRDFGRFRESQRRRRLQRSCSNRDQSAMSRHHFGRSGRVSESPVSREQAKEKAQMDEIEIKRKTSKGGSSTAMDSRISAACSCRPIMEEEESVSCYYKENNYSTQFMDTWDRTQLAAELESRSGNGQHLNVAGLPSPVNESEDSVLKCLDPGERFKVCDSFVVVKSSCDPQKDFRESMVQMIMESDIHDYPDLQKLLQCYLSLNPVENHNIIVKAFNHVTSDFTEI